MNTDLQDQNNQAELTTETQQQSKEKSRSWLIALLTLLVLLLLGVVSFITLPIAGY